LFLTVRTSIVAPPAADHPLGRRSARDAGMLSARHPALRANRWPNP
jgi:hypothetical protein